MTSVSRSMRYRKYRLRVRRRSGFYPPVKSTPCILLDSRSVLFLLVLFVTINQEIALSVRSCHMGASEGLRVNGRGFSTAIESTASHTPITSMREHHQKDYEKHRRNHECETGKKRTSLECTRNNEYFTETDYSF
jgi:hypothetical protein